MNFMKQAAKKAEATAKVVSVDTVGDALQSLNAARPDKYTDAIKSALESGVNLSVDILSTQGGFLKSKHHITWPAELASVANRARSLPVVGAKVDEFEEKMNVAAERAVRECLSILLEAVAHMTLRDALGLFKMGDHRSMTHFMQNVTWDPLNDRCRPPIDQILHATGVPQLLGAIVQAYNSIPLMLNAPAFDLTAYVTTKCLEAVFDELGAKEEAFREDPWSHLMGAVSEVFGEFVPGGRPETALDVADPAPAPTGMVAPPSVVVAVAVAVPVVVPVESPPHATLICHVQNKGDVTHSLGEWAGTKGQNMRLEALSVVDLPAGVKLLGMAHVQDVGDTPWIELGQPDHFLGSKGKGRRMEGLALKLEGPDGLPSTFGVRYRGHFAKVGDSEWCQDGDFCGSRGKGLGAQAVLIEFFSRQAPVLPMV